MAAVTRNQHMSSVTLPTRVIGDVINTCHWCIYCMFAKTDKSVKLMSCLTITAALVLMACILVSPTLACNHCCIGSDGLYPCFSNSRLQSYTSLLLKAYTLGVRSGNMPYSIAGPRL